MSYNKKFPLNPSSGANKKGLKKVFEQFNRYVSNYLSQYPEWNYKVEEGGGSGLSFELFYKDQDKLGTFTITLSASSLRYDMEPTTKDLHIIMSSSSTGTMSNRVNQESKNISMNNLQKLFENHFEKARPDIEQDIEDVLSS